MPDYPLEACVNQLSVFFSGMQTPTQYLLDTTLLLNSSVGAATLVAQHPGYGVMPPVWCPGPGVHVPISNVGAGLMCRGCGCGLWCSS